MPTDAPGSDWFCVVCASDDVEERHAPHRYYLKDGAVVVEDDWHLFCHACGAVTHPGAMLDASFRAVAAQKRLDQGLLPPADLRALRLRYGFTQVEMEKLLGCGEKTWIRWEKGKVTPSKAQDALIRRLADDPRFVARRMAEAGIENATAAVVAESAVCRAARAAAEVLSSRAFASKADELIAGAAALESSLRNAFAPRNLTQDALAIIQAYSDESPIDVEGLALNLGCVVFRDPTMPRSQSGRIERLKHMEWGAGYAIWINAGEAAKRQRFTLAHEIAHVALHADCIGDGIVENAMHRSAGVRVDDERDADRVAAAILMPERQVRAAFAKERSVARLADQFDVSDEAMRVRLRELRLG
jgi:putative zinc finger/helix-turn-helix YgiT family protein